MSKIYRANTIVESEIGDDLLLFEAAEQRFHALNLSGKIIWKNFFSEDDFDDCVAAVKAAFALSPKEDITADVRNFISALQQSKLLVSQTAQRGDPGQLRTFVTTVKFKNKDYVAPSMQEIPMAWLKQRHPSALVNVAFSDTWGPATDDLV